jgi:hypothetical protein
MGGKDSEAEKFTGLGNLQNGETGRAGLPLLRDQVLCKTYDRRNIMHEDWTGHQF